MSIELQRYYIELEKIVIEYTKHQQQEHFRKQLLKFEEEKQRFIEAAKKEKEMLVAAHEAEIEALSNRKDPRLYIFQNDITDAKVIKGSYYYRLKTT